MAGTKKSLESDNVDLLQARRLMLSMAGMLIKNKPADMSVGGEFAPSLTHFYEPNTASQTTSSTFELIKSRWMLQL